MTDWNWWYSQDEERYYGPCVSREEAIECGFGDYGDEPFHICEARKGKISTYIPAYRLLEYLDEANEEVIDQDGDGRAFDTTNEQDRDLERVVEEAIRSLAVANKLSLVGWSFEETRNQESIDVTSGDYGPLHRLYYHGKIAEMGRSSWWEWMWRKLSELYPQTKSVVGREE